MASGFPNSIIGESEKLDGSNYTIWKFKIRNILVARKLRRPSGIEMDTEDNSEWEDANSEAFALIGMTIADEIIPHIQSTTEAKEAWDILREMYETTDLG